MPHELSMAMRQESSRTQGAPAAPPAPAPTSPFEERIVRFLCQPILRYIPRSVRPNSISLMNHGVSWVTAILAVSSVQMPHPYRSLALAGAGIGMLLSMIGDCLDGMHARATNQCSKLGEMMDHWLDAIVVPLVVLGASLALEMEPWAIAAVNVTATTVYNGQLVLYHHTGKFVHPEPTTGMEAQFGLSLGYVAYGALLYFVDRDHLWLDYAVLGIALLGLYIQMRCNAFYYVRLKDGMMKHHLVFLGLCSAFGVLYLLGAISLYAFAVALTFTSFRVCGTYVLFTIVGRRYDGGDLGVVGFIAAIAAAHWLLPPIELGPLTLQALLPYLASAYMLARNLLDLTRHYAVFQPTPRGA